MEVKDTEQYLCAVTCPDGSSETFFASDFK